MNIFWDRKIILWRVSLLLLTTISNNCFADDNNNSVLEATFVFGDSLVEVGNNNYIATLSRANYKPNGIDFGKPTGRFTNGRTIVDIIGQEVGLKDFTPPYLAPTTKGSVILNGVNYASGAGGILNYTGKLFGGRIYLDAQIDNFENTRQDIVARIGEAAAQQLFKNALFSVTIGSNDFINNYLTPVVSVPEQKLVPPEVFVGIMVSRFRLQLTVQTNSTIHHFISFYHNAAASFYWCTVGLWNSTRRLYGLGARKFVVANVGPIGCIPYQRDINFQSVSENNCVDFPNQLAQLFNSQLKSLLQDLTSILQGSKFVYADVYHIVADIIQNYESYGFENADSACCYVAGHHGGLLPCGQQSKVCGDRSKYVFWDPYHPSDATNVLIAKRILYGDSNDISPINILKLIQS